MHSLRVHHKGLIELVREEIPSKQLLDVIPSGLTFSYNSNVGPLQNLTLNISRNFDFYTFNCGNVIVTGIINAEITNTMAYSTNVSTAGRILFVIQS